MRNNFRLKYPAFFFKANGGNDLNSNDSKMNFPINFNLFWYHKQELMILEGGLYWFIYVTYLNDLENKVHYYFFSLNLIVKSKSLNVIFGYYLFTSYFCSFVVHAVR